MLLRAHNLLHIRHLQIELRQRNAALDEAVRKRTAETEDARLASLRLLATAGEYHDDDTHDHTQRVGYSAALGVKILSSGRSPVIQLAAEVARAHHEWWGGSFYPTGRAADDIPISGRITAAADVFDALTHARPYKPAWDSARAVELVCDMAGRQFDPKVIEAFLTLDPVALRDGVAGGESPSLARA